MSDVNMADSPSTNESDQAQPQSSTNTTTSTSTTEPSESTSTSNSNSNSNVDTNNDIDNKDEKEDKDEKVDKDEKEDKDLTIVDSNKIDIEIDTENLNNSDKEIEIEEKEKESDDKDMMDVDASTSTLANTTTTTTTNAPRTPDNNATDEDYGGLKILPKTLAALTQPIQDDQTPAYLVSNKDDIDITQTNLDEPRDARVIKNILKTMGVQAHDPRVVNQLLEFMFKYVYEVLQDSVAYSDHSGRSDIDISDIRLSIQSRVNFSFTQPPPRELLLSISEEKNKIPLPPIPQKFGILLPPDDYCLTYPNYQVDPPKPPPPQPVQPLAPQTQRGQYNKKIPEKQIPIRLNVTQPPTIINPPINGKHQDK